MSRNTGFEDEGDVNESYIDTKNWAIALSPLGNYIKKKPAVKREESEKDKLIKELLLENLKLRQENLLLW